MPGREVTGERNGPLGTMWDPVYINQGIAIHGANNVPLEPASHGCIRVSRYLGPIVQQLIDKGDNVYIWDGKKEPEQQTAKDRQMIWDWVDLSRTTTTTSTTTTTTTTVAPTTHRRRHDHQAAGRDHPGADDDGGTDDELDHHDDDHRSRRRPVARSCRSTASNWASQASMPPSTPARKLSIFSNGLPTRLTLAPASPNRIAIRIASSRSPGELVDRDVGDAVAVAVAGARRLCRLASGVMSRTQAPV